MESTFDNFSKRSTFLGHPVRNCLRMVSRFDWEKGRKLGNIHLNIVHPQCAIPFLNIKYPEFNIQLYVFDFGDDAEDEFQILKSVRSTNEVV